MKDIFEEMMITLPKKAELIKPFIDKWEPVVWVSSEFSGLKSCSKCGAIVFKVRREDHEIWHKNIGFTFWLLSSSYLDLIRLPE